VGGRAVVEQGLDQLALGVEDGGLPLFDVAFSPLVEVLVVHAAEYLDRVAGSADAAFPVAFVQPLPCVGQVPDDGVVVVGEPTSCPPA
jgi:hypothetical protein